MKKFERYAPFFAPSLLIIISLVVSGYFIHVAATRSLTYLEGVLLQLFSLLAGVGGSFIFGQQSVRKAAKDIIKPHARSAFRRLLSLYHSLSRVAATIESSQTSSLPVENQVTLAKLEAIVVEQLASADDAIEEWKDIVPEDVEELDQRFSSDKTTRDRQ